MSRFILEDEIVPDNSVSIDLGIQDIGQIDEIVPDNSVSIDRQVEYVEVMDAVKTLSPRLQEVVKLIYEEGRTLEDAGRNLGGITRERVRQIRNEALSILRKKLSD